MKHRALAFLVRVSAILLSPAGADAKPYSTKLRLSSATGFPQVIVPAEWSGVWTLQDSTFDCLGMKTDAITENDTLCTGQNIYEVPEDLEGLGLDINCTVDVTPTTLEISCTATGTVGPDCLLTYTYEGSAVRTGDTYRATTHLSITVDGVDPACSFFPDQCIDGRTSAVRIAPQPTAYCATPAVQTTWGQVKSRYH
jgi:hypothetical protein